MGLLQMKTVALCMFGMQRVIEQVMRRRVGHGRVLHEQQQGQQ